MSMTYRQYLQHHANNHPSETKRREAQSLLNVVGDDRKLDGNFLTGEKYGFLGLRTREKQSNGFNASTVNRVLNPWWSDSYNKYLDNSRATQKNNINAPTGTISSALYSGGGSSGRGYGYNNSLDIWRQQQAMREAEAKRKEQENNAKNLAYINDQLSYMPGALDRINRAERNKISFLNDGYSSALSASSRAWNRAVEDYEADKQNRLKTRARRIGVANEDFRKQRDAYDRYFARIGAGSSSASQITAPTLLAQGASKIRNEIEDENAEQDRLQTLSFNRAKQDHEFNLMDLARNKAKQESDIKSAFENKRAGYYNELSNLQRQKSSYEGKDYNTVINESKGARDKAESLANSAVDYTRLTPEMSYREVKYNPVGASDWKLKPMQSKVNTGEEKPIEDDAYNRFFRDEEERKKREKEKMVNTII